MRQSDRRYKEIFERVTAKRKTRFDAITVINFHQGEEFYSLFENVLPTRKFLRCDEGFITQNSKELLENITRNNV